MRNIQPRACCQIPLPIRCQPRFADRNSAAAEAGKIIHKTLIYKRIERLRGRFSGVKRIFSPVFRGMPLSHGPAARRVHRAPPAGVRALAAAKLKARELFDELLDARESYDRGSPMRWTSLAANPGRR